MGKTTIKASVFDIEITNKNLFSANNTLEDMLKELSLKLEDKDSNNTRKI